MAKTLKTIILILLAALIAVVIYYLVAYIYLSMYAAFTWQCNIYVGEMTPEGRKVCNDFNSGGMIKVLTN